MTDQTPSPDDRLRIAASDDDGTPTFVLAGEVDPHTAPTLQSRIDEALTPDTTRVVLDMGGVTFVDSAGLRVVADTQRRLGEAGGRLTLRHPSASLQKLLSVTGLAEHVDVDEGS